MALSPSGGTDMPTQDNEIEGEKYHCKLKVVRLFMVHNRKAYAG